MVNCVSAIGALSKAYFSGWLGVIFVYYFSYKFNILGNGALHIFNLTSEDSGSYKCRVKSSLGWTDCGPVMLEVSRKGKNSFYFVSKLNWPIG